jgi:ribonuclease P protein component
MSLNSFSKKERLKKNDAIKAVLDRGICYRAKSINVYVLKRPDAGINKAAFICKKALHQKKAVLRNRVRRILKEAYRKTRYIFPAGYDIVIIGTKITQTTLSTGIEREIIDVFKKYIKK